MKTWLIALAGMLLTGCFHWVDNGHSGVAERWPLLPEQRTSLAQTNARLLLEGQFQLAKLTDEGARDVAPARLHTARVLWVRAVREHSNGLHRSAHSQLLALGELLETLQGQLKKHQPAATTPYRGGIQL